MQDDRERMCLSREQAIELVRIQRLRLGRHAFGHVTPGRVAHVVDVAITAIQIAAAYDLQQDRVDAHDRGSLTVVAVVRPVVAPRHFGLFIPNFVKQASESGAIQRRVERFLLGYRTLLLSRRYLRHWITSESYLV